MSNNEKFYDKQVSISDVVGGIGKGTGSVASFFYHFSPSTVVDGTKGIFSKFTRKSSPEKDLKNEINKFIETLSKHGLENMDMIEFQKRLVEFMNTSTIESIIIDSNTGEILDSSKDPGEDNTKQEVEAQEQS
jgi:hypothetical protein